MACAGAKTKSNEGKLIGIIVGVVIACVISLLIALCCFCVHRRQQAKSDSAIVDKSATDMDPKADSVYVRGIKVDAVGGDGAATDSPAHQEKMRKLQNMNFARTKSSPLANSPGAAAGAIGAKGFAFPTVASPGGGGAFGSPVYTPRGGNLISQLFSTNSGSQVAVLLWFFHAHLSEAEKFGLSIAAYQHTRSCHRPLSIFSFHCCMS